MYETILIILSALLPVAVALIIIYKKDSNQPEPVGKLFKAFFFGVLSAPLSFLLSGPFAALGLYNHEDYTFMGQLSVAFFGAAIPEEFFKLVMLYFAVRKNKYFDEHFDGIVYAVCIGMGFAGLENLMYLFENYSQWVQVGIGRAIFSIPGHYFFAILMGYFYSLGHFSSDNTQKRKYFILAFVAPMLAHAIYDGLLMLEDVIPEVAFAFSVAVIYLLDRLRKKTNEHIKHLLSKDGIE